MSEDESPSADGSPAEEPAVRVRVRGIYATALTRLLREAGHAVVQPSAAIAQRFDDPLGIAPETVSVESTRDREGVGISGDPDAVETVAGALAGVAVDAIRVPEPIPAGAVYDAEVVETRGGGAVVDLGPGADRRGYLPFDDVDGYVDVGQRYRVQVHEPTPPWSDDLPRVGPDLVAEGGLCTLDRGGSGVSASVSGERAAELVGLTDLLSTAVPDGWGLQWRSGAVDAPVEALEAVLERATERAERLEAALADAGDGPGAPGRVAAPASTAWCWFGRTARFALDDHRRAVVPTMAGHHRIKVADETASAAVDFAEAVCGSVGAGAATASELDEEEPGAGDGAKPNEPADASTADAADGDATDFPFEAVARQFGPTAGDSLALVHGKPDGRAITLGTGEVTDWAADGSLTVRRELQAGGTYDALGTPKEAGDVAVTKLREGRWWYATTYRAADGTSKGTYVNVCTPVELFPDRARYVDLYVDVVRRPDGAVEVVDEDELAAALADGHLDEPLAGKARRVATAVERALSG